MTTEELYGLEIKYYTPSLDEFRLGFEYEIFEDFDHYPTKEWHKQVYGKDGANPEDFGYITQSNIENKTVRVKFFSHQDLVELGFKESGDEPEERFDSYNGNTAIQLYFDDKFHDDNVGVGITIYKDSCVVFNGYVKNKFEMKRLIAQLKLSE